MANGDNTESNISGREFFFVLADEVLPGGKVVRKVIQFPISQKDWILANPELYGIKAPNPKAAISIGEHALGANRSPYLSASTRPGGAPNIAGRPVWIDVSKVKAAGGTIHTTADIIADLNRIAAENASDANMLARIDKLKRVISKVEREVLIQGDVAASAIKSRAAMNATRSLRFVQVIGFGLTVYDLGKATHQSFQQGSSAPLAAETIRQTGGWGAAWIGIKVGAAGGAALGIETGPGAVITAGIGALVLGSAGYFGADWVADLIHEN